MIEKNHPNLIKKLGVVILASLLSSGLIFCNLMRFIKPQIIPTHFGIVIAGIIIFFAVFYGFWAGNHVKCPECMSACKRYSDELNKNRKVICRNCNIIWNLGVSYNTDADGGG